MKANEKLLLIDTTGERLLVALVGNDAAQERTNPDKRRHSETINAIAKDFIPRANAFAVVNGQSSNASWTGTRVGVVAVKAWAFATDKPIIELETASFDIARQKFDAKDFTDIDKLEPKYSAEFKVTPPKK